MIILINSDILRPQSRKLHRGQ